MLSSLGVLSTELQEQEWRGEWVLSGTGSCTFVPVNCCLSGMQVKGRSSSSFSTRARYPDFYVIFKRKQWWLNFTKTLHSTHTVGVSHCRSAASDRSILSKTWRASWAPCFWIPHTSMQSRSLRSARPTFQNTTSKPSKIIASADSVG